MSEETSQTLQNLLNKRDSLTAVTGTDINRVVSGYNDLNVISGTIIKILQDEIKALTIIPPKLVLPKEPVPRSDK